MPASHGNQKRAEKQKKRRDALRKKERARKAELALPTSEASLVRRAAELPFGPSFISPEWRKADESMPSLVSVVVTRRAPSGMLIPALAMVDRTCLGVKNGFVGKPVPAAALPDFLGRLEEIHGGMEPCELLVAQSVVFHALDYARSLGFAPHPDFPAALFGARPEKLLDTPLAHPSRPSYVSGPDDNVELILEQLQRVAGKDFDLVASPHPGVRGTTHALAAGAPATDQDEDEDEDEET